MRTVRHLAILLLSSVTLLACEKSEKQSEGAAVMPAKSATPAAGEHEVATPSVAKHMQDHFTRGAKMRDAIIAGDLEAAKKDAQWMAEHQVSDDLPDNWKPHVKVLKDAAKQTLDAQDIAAAAMHTAAMSRACGECHAKLGGPKVELGKPPVEGSGAAPHMARHQWAADRMWDALTVPSEQAWLKATEVMADAPLAPMAIQGARSVPPVAEKLAKEVHDIAEAARADRQMEKWSSAYGRFLGTCAECHQALKQGPSKR
jgi:mono/diheme cytochrome c family protein